MRPRKIAIHPLLANPNPSFRVPAVGTFRLSFDHIRLSSTRTKTELELELPMDELEQASHRFRIKNYKQHRYYRSQIRITCTANGNPLWLLHQWEAYLGHYATIHVEIAVDCEVSSEREAIATLLKLIERLGKRYHRRGSIWLALNEDQLIAPKGLIPGPTIYMEHATSTMRLKVYCRYDKLLRKRFSIQPLTRLEWTLTGDTITRHLGGKQLSHLLNADLLAFVQQNLRLEEVNYKRLGKLLVPSAAGYYRSRTGACEKNLSKISRAERAAHFHLRRAAYEQIAQLGPGAGDWVLPMIIYTTSPAHIRGQIQAIADGGQHSPKRGRPRKNRPQRRKRRISTYRKNLCFRRIPITP